MTAARHLLARACLLLATVTLCNLTNAPSATAQGDAWALLREPGVAVFLRHADAPGSGGFGDPPGFRLDDCTTQRNLSEDGRAQARRTAEALRGAGVAFDRVLTSPWCRCKETAELVVPGTSVEGFEPLSNLVGRSEHRERQVTALKAYLAGLGSGRALLVTHGIVVSALAGIQPAQGEMIIVRPGPGGEPVVAGRLRVD